MCSVFGALLTGIDTDEKARKASSLLMDIMVASRARGRDGLGYVTLTPGAANHQVCTGRNFPNIAPINLPAAGNLVSIGNARAEPTTEFVSDKRWFDQQPYGVDRWWAVHNGTVANDHTIRTNRHPSKIDSAAIPEVLAHAEALSGGAGPWDDFDYMVKSLRGSYAILAAREGFEDVIFYAVNYRPIWYIETEYGVFFASCRSFFPVGFAPQMLEPYTSGFFASRDGKVVHVLEVSTMTHRDPARSLVVCSGGLDSVVAATMAQRVYRHEVELVHFHYGSRAQGPETAAVQAAANALGVPVRFVNLPFYKPDWSPLLRHDSAIAGGEAGAEFAHEWVPARNLMLLAVATAIAEAEGFDYLVLGNNMEEAGAYPDNEPEFINRFNDLLPFAVGDGKHVRILMPVGNMMKHEIVEAGLRLGAPLDKTWSCYRAGEKHCGTCGPCHMRRIAFQINNAKEVIDYEV